MGNLLPCGTGTKGNRLSFSALSNLLGTTNKYYVFISASVNLPQIIFYEYVLGNTCLKLMCGWVVGSFLRPEIHLEIFTGSGCDITVNLRN